MSENYDLVCRSRRKCEINRDSGISKNVKSKESIVKDLKTVI